MDSDIQEGRGIRGVRTYKELMRYSWNTVYIQCLVCDNTFRMDINTWKENVPQTCPECGSHSLAHEWIEADVFEGILKRVAEGVFEPLFFPEDDDIHTTAIRRYVRIDSI